MENPSRLRQAALYVLLFLSLLLLTPRAGFADDVNFWVAWARTIFWHGLSNAYEDPTNMYNPLFHYLLFAYGKLAGSADKIYHYRNSIKGFILPFDFAGALLAASLVPERPRRFALTLLLLFNIGYLYNTLLWEQIDAVFTCLVFAAVVVALRNQVVASAALFVLAMLAKAQAILFLPPLLLLWLPQWIQAPRTIGWTVGTSFVVLAVVLAPFMWFGEHNSLARIIEINTTPAIGLAPSISMNAANLWVLLLNGNIYGPDSAIFASLSYRAWGLLLFGFAATLALVPLLIVAWRHAWPIRSANLQWRPVHYPMVLLVCALLPLVSTFFNTRMHERYWHSGLLFLAAYSFLTRRYGPFVLLSVAYFLNLETLLKYLGLFNYKVLIFDMRFIAGLFVVVIVWSLISLYRLLSAAGWATRLSSSADVSAPSPVEP